MRNRKSLVVISGVVLFLILGLRLILNQPTTLTGYVIHIPEPYARAGSEEVVFSNGRQFVDYNIVTGNTRTLGKSVGLPGEIRGIRVSDDGKNIVFQATNQYEDDQLGQILKGENTYGRQPFWWVYNVVTDTYKHLPDSVINVSMSGNNLYTISKFVASDTDGEYNYRLDGYLLPDLKPSSQVFTSEFISLYSNKNLLLGSSSDNTLSIIDKLTGKTTIVSSDTSPIDISNSSPFFLAKKVGVKGSVTGVINLSKKNSFRKIASSRDTEDAAEIWSFNGNYIIGANGSNNFKIQGVTGKKPKNIRVKTVNRKESLLPTLSLSDNLLLVRSDQATYAASNSPLKTPAFPDKYKKKLPNDTLIEFNSATSTFLVSMVGPLNNITKKSVYDTISSDGFDVNFWQIRFTESGF